MKYFIIAIAVFALTNVAVAKAPSCKHFKDQAEAQRYFQAKKNGWKRLDRDKDGEACECLTGGSSDGKSVCRIWRKKHGKY